MTRAALCWLIVMFAPLAAVAQPLEVFLTTPSPRCRTAAPMIIFARFESPYGQTYDGHLRLLLTDQGSDLLSWTSPLVVLTGGEQLYRYMLPPMLVTNLDGTVNIRATFVPRGEGETIYLGEHVLVAPNYLTRNGVIAVCDPWGRSLPRHTQTVRSLRLDRFDPADANEGMVNTVSSHLPPTSMPTDAIGYTPFDVVALIGDGLISLEPPQLDAITAWVRAGGSVYVAPGRAIEQLPEAHRRFLRQLGDDEFNRVQLGRAVIDHRALSAIEDDNDSKHQRDVAAYLWKVHARQRDAIVNDGTWRTDLEAIGDYRYATPREPNDPLIHRINPTIAGEALPNMLDPGEVRIIPFKVIAMIMVGFVLAIGPVDYLLLGALRRRKWTWFLFPIVTAVFTWTTVAMSNHYVGRADHRRTLTLIDVGDDNRVLRETNINMIFAGGSRDIVTEHQQETFAPLFWEIQQALWQFNYSRSPVAVQTHYEGRFPAQYVTRRYVEQWSPQFYRTTTIAPDREVPIDFDNHPDVDTLEQAYPQYDFHLVDADHIINDPQTNRYYAYAFEPVSYLKQLTARQPEGFFSVVSQVSPTGGDSFEDLAIVDTQDESERAVIAIEYHASGLTVYRRRIAAPEEAE